MRFVRTEQVEMSMELAHPAHHLPVTYASVPEARSTR